MHICTAAPRKLGDPAHARTHARPRPSPSGNSARGVLAARAGGGAWTPGRGAGGRCAPKPAPPRAPSPVPAPRRLPPSRGTLPGASTSPVPALSRGGCGAHRPRRDAQGRRAPLGPRTRAGRAPRVGGVGRGRRDLAGRPAGRAGGVAVGPGQGLTYRCAPRAPRFPRRLSPRPPGRTRARFRPRGGTPASARAHPATPSPPPSAARKRKWRSICLRK